MTEPNIDPAPLPPGGPTCTLCGGPAVVHWQRRLNAAEIAEEQAREQARRDDLLLLADPDGLPPEFGPLPDCADYTRAVHGCDTHYISRDLAALIHQPTCGAPASGSPKCDCTPEAAPGADPEPPAPELPPGW